MDADEQYVTKRWRHLHIADDTIIGAGTEIRFIPHSGKEIGDCPIIGRGRSRKEAFCAAKAYTVERERQIAEVKEEIKEISHAITEWKDDGDDDTYQSLVYKRILSLRLQPVLDALKQGMKQ